MGTYIFEPARISLATTFVKGSPLWAFVHITIFSNCGRSGTIRETRMRSNRIIGDDYVMITDWDRIGGFPIPGERIIPILLGISVIHSNDCRRCEKILHGYSQAI